MAKRERTVAESVGMETCFRVAGEMVVSIDDYNMKTERIAELERQLVESNDRYVLLTDELWHIFGEQDRRDYAVQAKEIIAKLTKAHKATSWISVDERQPTMPFQNANGKYSQDVLVLLDNDLMRVCYYHDYRWELAGFDKVQVENVLYWQELSIPLTIEVN